MDAAAKMFTDQFLRNFCGKFTARELSRFFSSIGVRASAKECEQFLENCPWVFELENGGFITKAGAFTGHIFSIKPTTVEYEQKMLILGGRCIPFVDSEIPSHELSLQIDDYFLPTKVGVFDSDLAIDMFLLYGEEYAPQYIASDPANQDIDFVNRDFELPNNVHLTGFDISILIDAYKMKKGDRLLCTVKNWDEGIIEIKVVHDGENFFDCGLDGSKRLLWYKNLEEALLESFETIGPCGTIEEQLGTVFFEKSFELSTVYCGSVEEYLSRYSKNIGIEHFGVETRLWYKGHEVPAIGKWNYDELDILGNLILKENVDPVYTVPPEVIDQYLQNMYYHRKSSLEELIEEIYPIDYVFHKDEKKYIINTLKKRNEKLSAKYNWFADQSLGLIREQALLIFKDVNYLVYRIDAPSHSLKNFPQQELVVLTQLYSHVFRILQSIGEGLCAEDEYESLLLSLDGMRWNLEDIKEPLESALSEQEFSKFKVVKRGEKNGH